jgi:hypothetical protein
MGKPILAVDVDGVISLFGFEETAPPDETRFEVIDGVVHCIPLASGEHLQRLSERFELVWASGWEARANLHLPAILGLPQLPYLDFGGTARFGSSHWKLQPLERYSRGRPLAWIDDCLGEACVEWARQRPEPTLLVATKPHLGIEQTHVDALESWARSLS